jgi:hypothetical protein
MPEINFSTEDAVINEYLPQIMELLKREVDGADLVHPFDWRVSLGMLYYN